VAIIKEHEWLVKEVHHRVKNNLHIITSLLSSQSNYLQGQPAINAIMDSRHRVQAISFIHQKLYKTRNISSVYLPELLNELIEYLREFFESDNRLIFLLEIEPYFINVVEAVPVILIINEIIIIVMKGASIQQTDSTFKMSSEKLEDIGYVITTEISTNLWKQNADAENPRAFSKMLIKTFLLELNGSLEIKHDNSKILLVLKFGSKKVVFHETVV